MGSGSATVLESFQKGYIVVITGENFFYVRFPYKGENSVQFTPENF